MDGDEYIASGQTSTGHDIFLNTNADSPRHHLTFYSQFGGKWYQSFSTLEEVEGEGKLYISSSANSDSLCPPSGLVTKWSRGSGPICKTDGPILTNHCAENNCHINADCTNTMESFKCACKSGFKGDGLDCTALPVENECENGNNTCDPIGSTCTDTQYSYKCHCQPGFWDADPVHPGRSCKGCCSTVEVRYSERFPEWPDWNHGRLADTCTLNTGNEYNDRYIYDCDVDNLKLFYFLNYPDPILHELGFKIGFHK